MVLVSTLEARLGMAALHPHYRMGELPSVPGGFPPTAEKKDPVAALPSPQPQPPAHVGAADGWSLGSSGLQGCAEGRPSQGPELVSRTELRV